MIGWNPPFPMWAYVALALLCVAVIPRLVWRSRRVRSRIVKAVLLLLRCAALVILFMIMGNPVVERAVSRESHQRGQLFLVDTSESMGLGLPLSRMESVRRVLLPALSDPNLAKNVRVQPFDVSLFAPRPVSALPEPAGEATHLGGALLSALQASNGEWTDIVVVSDGRAQDRARIGEAVAWSRRLGVPVSTFAVGEEMQTRNLAIESCFVERHASPNTRLPVRAQVRATGLAGERCELVLVDEAAAECARLPFTATDGLQDLDVILPLGDHSMKYTLLLTEVGGEITHIDNRYPFHIDIRSNKIRVLYMEGSPSSNSSWSCREYDFVRHALEETGEIDVDVMTVDRQVTRGGRLYCPHDAQFTFPTTRKDLFAYDVIICSDINRFLFSEEQKQWTVDLVSERGGGFCMVGGITSFSAGGWDQTLWDKLIPVDMAGPQRGHVWELFKVYVPKEARKHPIMQIDANPVMNDKILDHIPTFFGTKLVARAKPAATVLGVHPTRNIPIFAGQSYGKGRTMAFMTDTTAEWGRYFETMWGEGLRDFTDLLPPGRRPSVDYRPRAPSPAEGGDNTYFKKYWVNIVRWLAENSQAHLGGMLAGNTERVTYRPGEEVKLRAALLQAAEPEAGNLRVVAYAKLPGAAPVAMSYEPDRKEYTGTYRLPEEITADEVEIEFVAQGSAEAERRDRLNISILHQKEEFRNPQPDFELMAELARATSGETLADAGDVRALLQKRDEEKKEPLRFRVPVWDTLSLWAALLALLAAEWILRRLTGP